MLFCKLGSQGKKGDKNMAWQGNDGMVRIPKEIYNIIRTISVYNKKDIKDITKEALEEWVEKHVTAEQRKIILKSIGQFE